ncbi:HEAT repeat domain-containing protein [Streptomyces sulfonofaciens]|uniref:HEAT repeat domain-containing protein n=1 Tax=Streptomyces sulfonofaciens TaxID=68272 RepID=UPI00167AB91E|nr:HEAT repeat domain-containing protein [Streptomyces sulfonofaciens]
MPGPKRVSARGTSAVGAGGDAAYNATGAGSSVQDNRSVTVIVTGPSAPDGSPLGPRETSAALDAYAAQIRAAYGRLDLEVLIPTTEGEHPRVDLRDVFVPPLLRADPPRVELPVELQRRLVERGELPGAQDEVPDVPGVDRGLWERARQAYRERPALAVLDTLAAGGSGRLVLLGDPGAGKSTLARYLALALTSRALTGPLEPLSGLLPVVVELRRYADADWRERSFEDFLAHLYEQERSVPPPALLRRRLESGAALVVFDGLDELFDPRVRTDVTGRITGFAARYPDARVVVTSRLIGYTRHRLESAGFRHYMIQSLTDEQIAAFADRWYAAVSPADRQEAERLRTRLRDAVSRSRPVRELAGNPLLLTILAIIARRQRLPRDRAGVYRHAVNVLIAHWDEDAKHLDLTPGIRSVADLDDRDRREMLERLARHMQNGEGGIAGNHVLGEEVERVFTGYLRETLLLDLAPAKKVARAMVRQFRERNFILSRYGSEVYGFVHRAFLEYLAASDIVRRYEQRELTDDELLDDVFARRAPDPAWHEVLLLIVGQISERVAGRAVDRILELDAGEGTGRHRAPPAVLALRALAEVRRIGPLADQSMRTAEALVRFWEQTDFQPPTVQADIEASLVSLGPNWPGRRRVLRRLHTSWLGLDGAGVAFGLYDDVEVLAVIACRAWNAPGRYGALARLARGWPDLPAVRALVEDRAVHDSSASVRHRALSALVTHWDADPAVSAVLRDRAVRDPDATARTVALYALAEAGATDPATRALLDDRALHDPGDTVRNSALDLLARGWHRDPAVRSLVEDRVTHGTGDTTREAALGALARYWSDDPAVRELVGESAVHDPGDHVREEALNALAHQWGDDPAVSGLLRERSAEDPSEEVRCSALDTLGTYWPRDPAVLAHVLDRAALDPSGHVRHSALQTLAGCWGEDPAVRALVQERAVRDEDEYVRGDALSVLAEHWGDDTGVRALVVARATGDASGTVRSDALDALADHWGDDPAVRALVADRATEDPSDHVRRWALTTLADHWRDEPAVRALVADRADHDTSDYVRGNALALLARHWPKQPEVTVPALVEALRTWAYLDEGPAAPDFLTTPLTASRHPEVRVTAARLLGALWPADPRTVPALRAAAADDPDEEARVELARAAAMAEAYAPVHDRLW